VGRTYLWNHLFFFLLLVLLVVVFHNQQEHGSIHGRFGWFVEASVAWTRKFMRFERKILTMEPVLRVPSYEEH
jgi:hypothetical protein